MGRMVHFEITAEDTKRAQAFYEIFGWSFADSGVPGLEYRLAHTGDEPMGIDGAIMPRSYRDQAMIPWIGVEDLAAMMEAVTTAGGTLEGERQTVPGVGDTVYCRDTEGNLFGMIEPLPRA